MHTSHDYITKEPKLWLIHNSDFSGEVYVLWELVEGPDKVTYEWVVPSGMDLLSGNIQGLAFYKEFGTEKKIGQIPPCIVGRAVATALRCQLTRKIVNFVEQL